MRNNLFQNITSDTESEATKIILALFGGIAAGSILTSLLVSQNKFNLLGRLLKRPINDSLVDEAALPHPEKYTDGAEELIIQPA